MGGGSKEFKGGRGVFAKKLRRAMIPRLAIACGPPLGESVSEGTKKSARNLYSFRCLRSDLRILPQTSFSLPAHEPPSSLPPIPSDRSLWTVCRLNQVLPLYVLSHQVFGGTALWGGAALYPPEEQRVKMKEFTQEGESKHTGPATALSMNQNPISRKRLFEPLGMMDTFFLPPVGKYDRIASVYILENGKLKPSGLETPGGGESKYRKGAKNPLPSGGMFSTAPDLLAFHQMMLNGGSYNGTRILSKPVLVLLQLALVWPQPRERIQEDGGVSHCNISRLLAAQY